MRSSTGTGSAMDCELPPFSRSLYALLRLDGDSATASRVLVGVPSASACELARAVARGTPDRFDCWRAPFAGRGGSCTRDCCFLTARPPRRTGRLFRLEESSRASSSGRPRRRSPGLVYGAYDARLLAPAWPPLLALMVLSALPAATALARRGRLALALPFALFAIVVVASNVYNIDGLRKSGWDQLRRTDDWLDRDQTRAIVLPALSRALVIVRKQMSPGDSLLSPEGAFRFFYPGHVEQSFPNSCGNLRPFRVFVLTTDEGSKRYMEDFLHVLRSPSFWAACRAAASDAALRRFRGLRGLPRGQLMRVAVLTTSYPRSSGDAAGRFVADAVEHVRARGVDVEVVGPEQYRHYGIAYGHGMVGNLRRRPWLALFVPALLASFVRAARRVDADLLHAHWLPAGWVAERTGKPYVVQVWGTDVELARRAPWLARRVLRGARLVIAASNDLAERARALGAREVRVIPSGVELPDARRRRGRARPRCSMRAVSRQRRACSSCSMRRQGLNLVVAGDGPLRDRIPSAHAGSSRTTSSNSSTRGLRWSPARRAVRASAWPASRRWRTAGPSWRRVSGACSISSSTARPGSSCRRATLRRSGPRSSGCLPIRTCGAGSAQRDAIVPARTFPGNASRTRPSPPTPKL